MPSQPKTIYSEKVLDFLIEYWMLLPLTLTMEHRNRWVRLLGLLWCFVWFLPAGIPWLFLTVPTLFAILIETTWKESVV